MKSSSISTTQEIRARISKAKLGLYVFGTSNEKDKWLDLLSDATNALLDGNEALATSLVERTDTAISNLWARIERWRRIQTKLAIGFALLLAILLGAIITFDLSAEQPIRESYRIALYGLTGASVSVALSLGGELVTHASNRMGLIHTFLRPIIGIANAIVAYLLLQSEFISFGNAANTNVMVALVSFAAGYSERFLSGQVGKVLN